MATMGDTTSTTTGGAQIARLLAAEGVEVVFGIIDGTYFGLTRALGEHGIRLVSPRHEATALHMAGAYARLTGGLGVAIASNGPGAANALSGAAVEQGEGNRVLLLTSWRRSPLDRPGRVGAYQWFDQPAAFRAVTTWSESVPSFDRLPELVGRALSACWSGRPGVVHLTVPEDVVNGTVPATAAVGSAVPEGVGPAVGTSVRRRPTPVPTAPPDAVAATADLLVGARAPLIHAGSGVAWAGAHDELQAVAELAGAAVTTSWAARDVIDERAAVAVPMPLVDLVQRVRVEADVVLVVGSRLGETDFWGKAPYWGRPADQRVVQVDVDPSIIGAQRPVELGVVADARSFLGALATELSGRDLDGVAERGAARLAAYGAERREALAALAGAGADRTGSPLHSAHLMPVCQAVAGDDAVWVLDGGNTAVWGASHLQVRRPRSVLGTWKLGMLGAGLGQALGAQVACPDRPVVALIGDGAMGFHPQEIETAVRHDLPVVFVVAVDRQWGMVKVNQEFATDADTLLTEGALPAGTLTNTDLGEIRWDLVAEAMGAHGERADAPDSLRDALDRGLASGRCTVIHVDVDPVAHKFAPNLATFKAMHDEPAG